MQKCYLIFGFFFLNQLLAAQTPKWMNYANDGYVSGILPTDEYIWVSTRGGLQRFDRATGQRQIIQPWNSGLRGIDLQTVDRAPDGKFWVSGNHGGLYHFDGAESWEQFYSINTGDTLLEIKDLKITPEGQLWFISYANDNCWGCTKLFHFNGSQFSEHTDACEAVLGSNGVQSIALDTAGIPWIASSYKMLRYDGLTVENANIPLEADEAIVEMGFDRNSTLWVGTQQSNSGVSFYTYRIRYFQGNEWSVLSESSIGGPIFQSYRMFNDEAGNFYVSLIPANGVGAAYAKFDGNNWEYTKISDMANVPAWQPYELVSVDNQGILWFLGASTTNGPDVYAYDGQTWKTYDTELYPDLGTYVYDVAFDCDNNTWFGGHGMFSKFDGLSWKNYSIQEMGINANYFNIWSLTVDTTNCDIWMSFYENNQNPVGFAKFDGSTFTKYSTPDGYDVFETAIAKNGAIWVASASSGLGKFDGSTWSWYDEQNSPLSGYVRSVTIDHAQHIWVTSNFPNTIVRWDFSDWHVFDQANSPIDDYSNWVFIDHEGMAWTSNANGLLRFNGSTWQAFSVPGTAGHGIYALAQDQNQIFWLSNRAGIHKWNGSTFETFNFLEYPLANQYSWRIRVDPFGNKWMVHNAASGVTVFNENGISNNVINPTAGVQGKVFFDANQDGQPGQTSTEPGIPNEKVYLQPNNLAVFTNYDGNFKAFPPPGYYELRYDGGEDYTPTSAQSLPLNMGTSELSGFNYGAWAENPEDSISLDLTLGLMRCGAEASVWISLTGYGLLEAAGDVTLQFDPALTFLHAVPAPDVIQGNLLTWHYSGLSLYELQQIQVVFQVPGVDAIGQILSLQADATVVEGNVVTATDEDDERGEIRCSYDPNDKAMAPTGPSVGAYSLLPDALDFTVRFQNSGNDTAFTVVIRDTLDADLDFSSLQIISFSHSVRTTLTPEGVLTFVFEKINLLWESIDDAGSQGFVKYRIAPKSSLPDPAIIRNTAHIYFDFNPAIVTNTTTGVLVETLPSVATQTPKNPNERAAKLFPNPSSGDVWIEWKDGFSAQPWTASIVDMTGRSIYQASFDQPMAQIRNLYPGFYFVFLELENKLECHKLVVTRH